MTAIDLPTTSPAFDLGPSIDVIVRSVDLEQLMLRAGFVQGRNRQWPCPNPQHGQTGRTPPVSVGLDGDRPVWCCHGCDARGDAVDWIVLAFGCTKGDAVARLRDVANLGTIPPPARRAVPSTPPPPLDPDDGRLTGDEADEVLGRYLDARKWRPEVAETFGLYAVRNAAQGHAIRHPHRSGGTATWWQDRALGDTGPKWCNPPGARRQAYARDREVLIEATKAAGAVVMVEGPADVIAMAHVHAGYADRTVGIPGTKAAGQWARAFPGLVVVVLTDPDDAGDLAAAEIATVIEASGGTAYRLRPPSDIADWLRDEGPDAVFAGLEQLAAAIDDEAPDLFDIEVDR